MDPILFGPFSLDVDQRRIFRGGTDLRLRPQAVRVLRVLSQRAGQPVSYEQLLKDAWDATFVSRHTVATTVSEIRKAFEEYASWIEYRPRIGYSLKVPRSDDQIRTGWHLSERRTRGGAYTLVTTIQAATVVGFLLFLAMYLVATLGLASYVPELFLTPYRLRGVGLCMTAGRAAATVVPYFTAWAYPRGGVSLVLGSFCGLLLFQAVAVFLFGIQTENRPLEELAPESATLGVPSPEAVKA